MITVIHPVRPTVRPVAKRPRLPVPVMNMYLNSVLILSRRYDLTRKDVQDYQNELKKEMITEKYATLRGETGKVWFCIEGVVSKASFVKVDTETITA